VARRAALVTGLGLVDTGAPGCLLFSFAFGLFSLGLSLLPARLGLFSHGLLRFARGCPLDEASRVSFGHIEKLRLEPEWISTNVTEGQEMPLVRSVFAIVLGLIPES